MSAHDFFEVSTMPRALLLSLLLLIPATSIYADAPRPNIVIIVCDDLGFSDIGCYGGEIDTPNLDRLAAGGLRFTDFHNNAKCSETRASIMTGLWHQQSKYLKLSGHVTMAEMLKSAGYATLMSGKWHLAGTPPQCGFDRYFGFLGGAINFFTGLDWDSGKNLMRLDNDTYKVPDGFYSTDAFTDYAIQFIDETMPSGKPFFLYLAHNAPHFPLQALPKDIEKYEGRYKVGWDVIRKQRYANLKELGIVDETWRLSPRDPKVEPWDEMTPEQVEFLEPMMAVYAAMVHRLDQNIGRLVDHLESNGVLNKTLILFFSDNGACPYQRLHTPGVNPGPADSDFAYDARWANMCSTPLRLYKQYAHEGGTATPMIAHWPIGINSRGTLTRFTSHVVDLMPTVVEIADAKYPESAEVDKILPMEGVSLLPAFKGETDRGNHPLFWEFAGNHAVRDGDWKLVAERSKDWELYDLSQDRSETQNLADAKPDTVEQLAAKYDAWATRVGAKTHTRCQATPPSKQSQLFDLP
jgi:arylsulfatase